MARSRSLFDDLELAIATATSLTAGDDPKSSSHFLPSTPLVSFDQPVPSMKEMVDAAAKAPPPASAEATEKAPDRPVARPPQTLVTRVDALPNDKTSGRPSGAEPLTGRDARDGSPAAKSRDLAGRDAPAPSVDDALGERKTPPKLPDLSGVTSPVARCEKIVSWISEATGATDVFLVDSAGCPLAGSIKDAEAKLASVGVVASSVSSLASSIAGNVSPLFELHIGEGPIFQLVGFKAGAGVYIVGFARSAPLTPRQAHAIRLACRHALGDTLRGGLWETE